MSTSLDTNTPTAKTAVNPIGRAKGRLAIRTRFGAPPEELDDLRRDLTAAKLERHIREAIAAAPPLSNDQRVSLGHLLTGGGGHVV